MAWTALAALLFLALAPMTALPASGLLVIAVGLLIVVLLVVVLLVMRGKKNRRP